MNTAKSSTSSASVVSNAKASSTSRRYERGTNISVNVMIPEASIMFVEMIIGLFATRFNGNLVGYTLCPTKSENTMNPFQSLWMLRIVYVASSDGELGLHKQYLIDNLTGFTIGQVFINLALSKHCGPAYSKPSVTYISSVYMASVLSQFPGFGYKNSNGTISYDHMMTATPYIQGQIDPSMVDLCISNTNGNSIASFGTTHAVPIWGDTFTVGQSYLVNSNGAVTTMVAQPIPNAVL